jgi:hypothetical protein
MQGFGTLKQKKITNRTAAIKQYSKQNKLQQDAGLRSRNQEAPRLGEGHKVNVTIECVIASEGEGSLNSFGLG